MSPEADQLSLTSTTVTKKEKGTRESQCQIKISVFLVTAHGQTNLRNVVSLASSLLPTGRQSCWFSMLEGIAPRPVEGTGPIEQQPRSNPDYSALL